MCNYQIIIFHARVLLNIGNTGNAASTQIASQRGSNLTPLKHDARSGAVQEPGDEGNYFIMAPSNLLEHYKPLTCILRSDTRLFMFYKPT